MILEDPKLLAAAKGQHCKLRVPGVCKGNDSTVVACHSPFAEDKGGVAIKADDWCISDGCMDCHKWLDDPSSAPEAERREVFHRGMKATLRNRLKRGFSIKMRK